MATNAVLAIKIIADATSAAKGLRGASAEVSKFDKGMQRANKAAAATVTGLVAVGVASFREANLLQQSAGAVDSVFGKQAKAVHQLARSAADDFGLSRSEYSQTAAVFGAQLKNMGVSAGKLVPTTDKLIGLGSDLASTFGGSTSDAVAAIGSLMRGEADPIERYGVGIKQVDVNARLAAQGQDKLTGSAKKTAETEARLALLMEQTTAAQGQRAREANTAASRQEVAMAKLKNAGASLGTVLLPVVAAIASKMAAMAGVVERNSRAFQIGGAVVGGFAVAVFAVNAAMKAYRATVAAVTAVKAVYTAAQTGASVATTAFATRVRASSAALAMNVRWQMMLVRQWVAQRAAAAAAIAQLVAHRVAMLASAAASRAQMAASKAAAAAQWILNAAMTANPIGLVIAGILLLVAGFVLAYKKSETFRNVVSAVMKVARTAISWPIAKVRELHAWFVSKVPAALQAMRRVASAVFVAVTAQPRAVIAVVRNLRDWLVTHVPSAASAMAKRARTAFTTITAPIQTVIGWVQALITKIQNIRWPSPPGWMKAAGGALGNLFGSYRQGPGGGATSAYAPAVFARPGELKAAERSMVVSRVHQGRGSRVTIVIQGAIDPVSTARQVRAILQRGDVARGVPS